MKATTLSNVISWVLCLVVGAVLIWFSLVEKDNLLQKEKFILETTARSLANYVSHSVIEADRTIVSSQSLVLSNFFSSQDRESIQDHFRIVANNSPEVLGLGHYDISGNEINATEYLKTIEVSGFIDYILKKHDEAWANPIIHTSGDVEGAVLSDEVIVSRALYGLKGERLGVGVAVLSLDGVQSRFQIRTVRINMKLDVVDVNNDVIFSIDNLPGDDFVSGDEIKKMDFSGVAYSMKKDEVMFAAVEANDYPLLGIAQLRMDDILVSWRKRIWLYLSVGFMSIVLINLVAVLFNKINRSDFLRREELERISRTDELTGAYNRRHFLQVSDTELSRSKRHGSGFTVMMLDIDFFKKVNDKYGHDVGDEALIQTVSAINKELRSEDTLCRFGGEEFVILLPETGVEKARIVAERILDSVRKIIIPTSIDDLKLTISGGFCEVLSKDENIDAVIKRADVALFRAKEAGRNKVFHYA